MSRSLFYAAAVAALFLAADAQAQNDVQEVVVTASRVGESEGMPYITVSRRADHLITRVRVVCDTRDESQRRDELRETLRNMIRTAAKTETISMGLGDSVLGDFNETMLDAVIMPDAKVDTSYAFVIIKTAVSEKDTYDSATSRIKKFIVQVPKIGRTEILRDERWDLTLIGPEKNRDEIIKKIADNAHHAAELFGPGETVEIEGLQQPVQWYQIHPLDLALYIPYSLKIASTR